MKRRTRSVSFDRFTDEFQDAPSLHENVAAHELWFTPQDFERFSRQAQQEAKTLKLTDEEYVDGLKETLDIVVQLSENIEGMDDVIYRANVEESGISEWCTETPYRGLEKMCSRKVRTFKRQIRKSLVEAIVHGPEETSAEKLAARASKRTRQSRLYARMMGLADEMAAKEVYTGEADQ